ncbi:hypothetical protein [Thermogemmatispora onikobensis]|uniref:hypothetical protein n=1 Tax=Thermogemmatispora onikobensis TaxID=732234 RepID=UPI00114D1560|nr:hypothetical protein [Thermogemmatispora onikobensis]
MKTWRAEVNVSELEHEVFSDEDADLLEASSGLDRVLQLTGALLWRGRREQGVRLLVIPLAFALFFLLLCLVTLYFPGLLTPLSRFAIQAQAQAYFGATVHGNAGLAMALLLIQGPYLIALFAAFMGATLAQNLVGTEAARGGLELLLSSAYRVQEVFVAFLLASFVLTICQWAILALGTLGAAATVLALLRIAFTLQARYIALAVAVPLPIALWANLGALFLGMAFPRLTQIRTGSTTNLMQLLAALPALALLILINIRPDLNAGLVAAIALGVGLAGSLVSAVLLRVRFRPEFVLEA